ncbi:cyclic GMP-AMP synthase-like [Genypterus blacodes]|uniref:cyclic GMP-AMP synthase-like n=1 Tax=Genypterus blacodes TaxID=154954 RepID=UPI003F7652CB
MRQTKSLDEPARPNLQAQASLPSPPGRAGEGEEPKKRERKQPGPADEKPAATVHRQKSSEACVGGDKSPQQPAKTMKKQDAKKEKEEETMKKQDAQKKKEEETMKKQDAKKEKEEERLLRTTLNALRIKMKDKAKAAAVINDLISDIMEHLKKNTLYFKDVQQKLGTGSYYENLKIADPDEFDVMMPMPVDRAEIKPFKEDGAFYSVGLKRGKNPLKRFQQEGSSHLSASEMLQDFREEVKKCVKKLKSVEVLPDVEVPPDVEVIRKKRACPAVTLLIRQKELVELSLDVVLCLEVKSTWPSFTQGGLKVERWLGGKAKQQFKYLPFYLVPKYKGCGTVVCDGVRAKDVWRLSFSHVEKAIMKNHGSKKTCCEAGGAKCCRKDCLKLLKHLLHLLKDQDQKSFEKICSYHAKTTLLHACCSRVDDSDWEDSRLAECFRGLLEDFEGHLTEQKLTNFFIPAHNLLSDVSRKSCTSLASRIREQRERGFPIFMENEK